MILLSPKCVTPAGFLKFVVSNVKDLELLLMHNRKYCGEIAHNVSTLKRKSIVERAAEVRWLLGRGTNGRRAAGRGREAAQKAAGRGSLCTMVLHVPRRGRARLGAREELLLAL